MLQQTAVASSVDIGALLSSEYDEEFSESGDFSVSGAFSDASGLTPAADRSGGVSFAPTSMAQRGIELSEAEREQRRERKRDADAIQKLRDENEALRRAAAAAENQATQELKAYRTQVEAVHTRSRAELGELRSKLTALQAERPAGRQKLSSTKADFAQLLIDGPRYEALRKCHEEDVSVVEHVQMRVYDLLLAAERKAAVALATSGASVGAGSSAAAGGGASALLNADAAAREALTVKLTEASARAQQKSAEAEEARKEARELRAEALAAAKRPEGVVRERLAMAEERLAALTASAEEKDARLGELKAEAARASRAAEEASASASYLTQDKEYLRVQVKSLEERLATSESRLAKEEGTAAELKSELARAKEHAMHASKEHAEEYASKLQAEMERWQLTSKAAHDATFDAHLAAVNTHKDSREMALADADKWQTRYAELKREHDASILQAAEAAGKAEAGQAELRAECKLKVFEAERLRMQCEQAFLTARQAQVDADARAEKLDVLKAEYYALKTSSATRLATLEAANTALTERVGTYERLEEELDGAVLQSGAIAAYEGDGGAGGGGAGGNAPMIRVPSSAQRRMQQCLGLAKDVLSAQKRAETAEAALLAQKGEVERLDGMVSEMQRRLRSAGQPQNYLAEQVELADARRVEAEAAAQKLAAELGQASETLAATREQNEQLLRDLESLLSQRGSLDVLRATLTRLLPPELAPSLVPSSA